MKISLHPFENLEKWIITKGTSAPKNPYKTKNQKLRPSICSFTGGMKSDIGKEWVKKGFKFT